MTITERARTIVEEDIRREVLHKLRRELRAMRKRDKATVKLIDMVGEMYGDLRNQRLSDQDALRVALGAIEDQRRQMAALIDRPDGHVF